MGVRFRFKNPFHEVREALEAGSRGDLAVGAVGDWSLGPVIDGVNFSVGVVCDPAGRFDWPPAEKGLYRWQTPGPRYLTRPTTGLVGRAIRAEYAVIGDGQFFGSTGEQSEMVYVCLFFRAPNWQNIDGFRWWSQAQFLLIPGVNIVEVPLDHAAWVSVVTPGITEQFLAAMASAIEVGLTFGNDEGRAHGVSSPTGGSTFVLRSFTVVE